MVLTESYNTAYYLLQSLYQSSVQASITKPLNEQLIHCDTLTAI